MNHSFNVAIATKYGVSEAIIIENLAFWIKRNIANNKNMYDGSYWCYNSVNAWCELFPYLSESKIKRCLKKLEDLNVLKSGCYNEVQYDRTKWYTIIDNSICQNYQFHLVKTANGIGQNSQPIPIINTDINTDIKRETKVSQKTLNQLKQEIENKKLLGDYWIKTVNQELKELGYQIDSNKSKLQFKNFLEYYLPKWEKAKKRFDYKACCRTWVRNSVNKLRDYEKEKNGITEVGGKIYI